MITASTALTHIVAWCHANPQSVHFLTKKQLKAMNHTLDSLRSYCDKNGLKCNMEEVNNGVEARIKIQSK